MTEKRFRKGYVLGDTGLIDEQKGEWFIENINSVSDLEKNWDKVIDKLNELAEENEQLKQARKFFEEVLFNVLYATSDYQGLVLNKEMLELIDDCNSLDELRERANYGIEEFKKEHKWLE